MFTAPRRIVSLAAAVVAFGVPMLALDPGKSLTQYTRTVWTQQQGLPQDTIRALAQTADGFLWLGTDEGLARFDGYEFVTFTRQPGGLPTNSITALLAARGGGLWIGTSNGLTLYRDGRFVTYTTRDGLADNVVTALCQTSDGSLWIAAGVLLSRFRDGKFVNYPLSQLRPLEAVRALAEDSHHVLWVAGYGGLLKRSGGRFVAVPGSPSLAGDIILTMFADRSDTLWIAGSKGLLSRSPSGAQRLYTTRDGLPDDLVRALGQDRDGNLWAGTNAGLSRFEHGRFTAPILDGEHDRDWVRCLLEDREGNLWVGMNGGLNRFRDARFTMYGRAEGLPSDQPLAVHQDREGHIWVGYHDSGLVDFRPGAYRVLSEANGLPSNEIFSIRETRKGELLLATRGGLGVLRHGRFTKISVPDGLGRPIVFDALEDRQGRLWTASPGGVQMLEGGRWTQVVPGGALLNNAAVVLSEGGPGTVWAGTYGQGLWRIRDGRATLLTTADGLGSDQIRSLYPDPEGALWVGTFGGGLARLRDGVFSRFTARDGLLSDNVSHIEDDGRGSLWLSTTRGICRVSKAELAAFAGGRLRALTPVSYGPDDGLRSAQCAPGYPAGGGGTRSSDGRLWFPTSRGLAVIGPGGAKRPEPAPIVHLVDVSADGRQVDFTRPAELPPGAGRIQFRYTGIHLTAPERVHYDYRLDGLDHDWVRAVNRRVINYNSLPHGNYRFLVEASLPGGVSTETSFSFAVLPHFYEKASFLWLCAAAALAAMYGIYQLRLRQIRGRFSLVLEERVRLAREVHDTLAQGFVGISNLLDAIAMAMQSDLASARRNLDLARKMARHSLTEARRSVMDLRASALEQRDLPAALAQAARQWTAGSPTTVRLDVAGESQKLPEDVEQHLMRIAQEAVTNALKHSGARNISIRLQMEPRSLLLRVEDDGSGFEPSGVFSALDGHFGLLGMRERAARLGGELQLSSKPGFGTHIEVSVPLS